MKPQKKINELMYREIKNGCLRGVQFLIRDNPKHDFGVFCNCHSTDSPINQHIDPGHHYYFVHYATFFNRTDILEYFLDDLGHNVNVRVHYLAQNPGRGSYGKGTFREWASGNSCLYIAVERKYFQCAKILLQNGIRIDHETYEIARAKNLTRFINLLNSWDYQVEIKRLKSRYRSEVRHEVNSSHFEERKRLKRDFNTKLENFKAQWRDERKALVEKHRNRYKDLEKNVYGLKHDERVMFYKNFEDLSDLLNKTIPKYKMDIESFEKKFDENVIKIRKEYEVKMEVGKKEIERYKNECNGVKDKSRKMEKEYNEKFEKFQRKTRQQRDKINEYEKMVKRFENYELDEKKMSNKINELSLQNEELKLKIEYYKSKMKKGNGKDASTIITKKKKRNKWKKKRKFENMNGSVNDELSNISHPKKKLKKAPLEKDSSFSTNNSVLNIIDDFEDIDLDIGNNNNKENSKIIEKKKSQNIIKEVSEIESKNNDEPFENWF